MRFEGFITRNFFITFSQSVDMQNGILYLPLITLSRSSYRSHQLPRTLTECIHWYSNLRNVKIQFRNETSSNSWASTSCCNLVGQSTEQLEFSNEKQQKTNFKEQFLIDNTLFDTEIFCKVEIMKIVASVYYINIYSKQ